MILVFAILLLFLSAAVRADVRDWFTGGSCPFGKPGLPFSFTYDGTDFSELQPEILCEAAPEGFCVTYTAGSLSVKAEVKEYSDTGALDWTLYFTNTGTQNSGIITALRALDVTVPVTPHIPIESAPFSEAPAGDPENKVFLLAAGGTKNYLGLHWGEYKLHSFWPEENSETVIQNPKMIPCQGEYAPYWNINWGTGGFAAGIGWAGNWISEFSRSEGMLHIAAGIKSHKLNTYLKPGETIRSPRIILCPYKGSKAQTGFTLFRRTMISDLCPKDREGRPIMIPLTMIVAGKDSFFVDENIYNSYLDASLEELKDFEAYWFDAYFQQDNYPSCRGSYHLPVSTLADKDRFPHGIQPITDRVKKAGKQLIMWFAPEVVTKDSHIDKNHPEYVMYPPEDCGEGYFALGNPEAFEYMADYLDTCIKTFGINIFRTDSETQEEGLNEYYGETAPDRIGIAENIYVRSLYRLWDELKKRNPGLVIDNCAGGGNRIEPELMSRSYVLWRSDVNCCFPTDSLGGARINQLCTMRLTNWLPWTTGGFCGTDPYSVRSGFCSGIASKFDPREPDSAKEEMKQALKECSELRHYAAGDFYVIEPGDESNTCWCAWQYHLPEEDKGYFVVFRRENSPYFGMTINTRCIDPRRTYMTEIYHGYEMSEKRVITGKELAAFPAEIRNAPGSLLVRYTLLPARK